MPSVTFHRAVNMLSSTVWYGEVTQFDATHVVISDGINAITYKGVGLTYDAYGLSGGTFTSYVYTIKGTPIITVTGLNASATTAQTYLQYSDPTELQNYLFRDVSIINGSSGHDVIAWAGQGHQIHGNGGNDYILNAGAAYGEAGNDTLEGNTVYGGIGHDQLHGNEAYGGKGNDEFWVVSPYDTVHESAGEGNDTLFISNPDALSRNYQLADEVENMVLSGDAGINATGNSLRNQIQGNSGDNILNGGAGADTMRGGQGDDTYVIDTLGDVVIETPFAGNDTIETSLALSLGNNLENLVLTGQATVNAQGNIMNNRLVGNPANNRLQGKVGNDTLDGGGGHDTLAGGMGDDTYQIDNTGVLIVEAGGQGTDTVISSIAYRLPSNVENLTFIRTDLWPFSLDTDFNGMATGNALNNTLTGNGYANLLNGGTGADTLIGAEGNDSYIVDTPLDQTLELAGNGLDSVQTSVSWTLSPHTENLTLLRSDNLTGTGNTADNLLSGNRGHNQLSGLSGNDTLAGNEGNDVLLGGAGADKLSGHQGHDTLTGGAGKDQFIFDTALDADANLDVITDFSTQGDNIHLDHQVFSGLQVGAMDGQILLIDASPSDANACLVYESASGWLYYDSDGVGENAALAFCQVFAGADIPANLNIALITVI